MLLLILALISCQVNQSDADQVEAVSREVIDLLIAQQYERVYEQYGSVEWKQTTSLNELIDDWQEHDDGDYLDLALVEVREREEYDIVEMEVKFSQAIVDVRMIFNESEELVSLFRSEGKVNAVKPEMITEQEVIVGEDSDFPLEGILTMPSEIDSDEALPVVVLVHGSGPHDRDSSVHAYKPFRDIAWGLAERGVAVLRYDKRTFTYGSQLSQEEMEQFTVYEETVEDAIRASEYLKSDDRIDAENVYLLGHSQGGMLAPRIDATGGDFAGVIILAGSPRPLWEIIYDQNIDLIHSEAVAEAERESLQQEVDQQYELAQKLDELSDEEHRSERVFGLPANYLYEMEQYDPLELIQENQKPYFILQGEKDFQVSYDKDYKAWQDSLKNEDYVTFKTYPTLNHFFIESTGNNQGTIAEYEQPGLVSEEVIEDLSQWILKNITK